MSTILDQNGQPLRQADLTDPQTARLAQLHLEVAGHPSRGITPAMLNNIMEAAERGNLIAQHELFRDMEERDGHIFSELSKRKSAVTKLNWDVIPPRNPSKEEESLAAYAKELLLGMNDFEDLLFDLLDGIGHGFSALELQWQRMGSDWTIQCAHHRPQTWFQLDFETRNELRLRDNSPDGASLQPFGWMLHIHRAMSGYTVRSGLARVLVWPYLFKHFSVGDLAEFLDIYGLPLRVGKFPSHATPEEKATLWRAVSGIGHNAAGIIPSSMAIEFQEAAKGTEKPFEAMIEWCEKTQSKAITGSTLGMDTSRGGLGEGLSNIQNEIRLDIRDSDCKQLAGTITRDLIYPLLAINKGWSNIRRCPRLSFNTLQPEDIKTYSDSLPNLVQIGMQIPVHWAHTRLGIPQPVENEDVLKIQSTTLATKPTDNPKTAARAALSAVLKSGTSGIPEDASFPDQAAIDGALADLDAALQPQVEAWLKPALDALVKVSTPDAALELLAGENPLVADNVLIEAVARAMFIADLVGGDSALSDLK